MASGDLIVGLEIGTSKICVIVGETRPDGTLKILGVGQAPSRDNFQAAAEAEMRSAKGYRENAFKIELMKRTLVRALTDLAGGVA